MKRLILFHTVFFISAFGLLQAQPIDEFFQQTDSFLQEYIIDGRVAYQAIKDNPEVLTDLLSKAESITVSKEDEKKYQAFWINAYNLLVIQSVVDNYPIKSPLDVPGFFDSNLHKIGGGELTLNDIENKKLRGEFPDEARFHFVLVCAGLGCPPIIENAYLPDNLESQLSKQTSLAINDPNFIRVNKKKVAISQIFDWYSVDFNRNGQNVIQFINQYRDTKISNDSRITYYEYDWKLNESK